MPTQIRRIPRDLDEAKNEGENVRYCIYNYPHDVDTKNKNFRRHVRKYQNRHLKQ